MKEEWIKKRALLSSKSVYTKYYAVKENNQEVGFISMDVNPKVIYLVLYEIFVPEHLRNNGYGSLLLRETEIVAKKLDYRKITINPVPFEKNISKSNLIAWYQKYGYSQMESGTGELEKAI
ncbi:GNAT family N-acetyltransferase [uncultured Desulfobacter sp.]|uniref:GNAT family N-acetyltransferase n=1 Tax=uncultured Desulfobacter sp. TaxID=240139 RepID=UPI002AA631D7|nr:GNAT family N-acetyltransferase [uncultured Desulfobacter sp.]